MMRNEDRYTNEIHAAHKLVADTRKGQDKQILKANIKNLRHHYPAMSYDEAEQLVIKLKFFKRMDLGHDVDLAEVDKHLSSIC